MCGSEVHEGFTALWTTCHSESICICARQKKQRSEQRGKKDRKKNKKKIKEMQMEGIKRAKQGTRSELDRVERMRNEGRDRGCIKMRGEGWKSEALGGRCWPYVVIVLHRSRCTAGVWTASTVNGKEMSLLILLPFDLQVIFEAVSVQGHPGFIAMDEIRVLAHPCREFHAASCNAAQSVLCSI